MMSARELEMLAGEVAEFSDGIYGPGECEKCERPCPGGSALCSDCRTEKAESEVRIAAAAEALRKAFGWAA